MYIVKSSDGISRQGRIYESLPEQTIEERGRDPILSVYLVDAFFFFFEKDRRSQGLRAPS